MKKTNNSSVVRAYESDIFSRYVTSSSWERDSRGYKCLKIIINSTSKDMRYVDLLLSLGMHFRGHREYLKELKDGEGKRRRDKKLLLPEVSISLYGSDVRKGLLIHIMRNVQISIAVYSPDLVISLKNLLFLCIKQLKLGLLNKRVEEESDLVGKKVDEENEDSSPLVSKEEAWQHAKEAYWKEPCRTIYRSDKKRLLARYVAIWDSILRTWKFPFLKELLDKVVWVGFLGVNRKDTTMALICEIEICFIDKYGWEDLFFEMSRWSAVGTYTNIIYLKDTYFEMLHVRTKGKLWIYFFRLYGCNYWREAILSSKVYSLACRYFSSYTAGLEVDNRRILFRRELVSFLKSLSNINEEVYCLLLLVYIVKVSFNVLIVFDDKDLKFYFVPS